MKSFDALSLESSLRQFLMCHLQPRRKRLLLAVSGGCDSMSLLAAIKAISRDLNLRVFAAHLVHHPESAEALRRSDLVKSFCRRRRIPLATDKVKAGNLGQGSPEERMRQARYRFLDGVAQKFTCDWILTGHQADDQAETIMLRIISGTGLGGLSGIPAKRGMILRPFLTKSKAELRQYCQKNKVPFAEDPSNADLHFPRNRIRHDLLPMVQRTLNPSVVSALGRLGKWAAEADEVIRSQAQQCLAEALLEASPAKGLLSKGKIMLDSDAISSYFNMIRKYVLLLAARQLTGTEIAFSAGDLERADHLLCSGRTGTMLCLPSGLVMVKHRSRLIITSGIAPPAIQCSITVGQDVELPVLGYWAQWRRPMQDCLESGQGLAADLNLGAKPARLLYLRFAQEGDRFHPLGATGEKRLFRFLTDRGVSRLEKRLTLVLEHRREIIWVIGHRISEKARVTEPNGHAWRLMLEPA